MRVDDETPPIVAVPDPFVRLERSEDLAQSLIAEPEPASESGARERDWMSGDDGRDDRALEIGGRRRRGPRVQQLLRSRVAASATTGDREVDGLLIAVVEAESERLACRCAAALDREDDVATTASVAAAATSLHVPGRVAHVWKSVEPRSA